MISHSGNWFIVALSKGRPVGLIVGYEIQRFPGDVMFLYEIDVHPDHRQKGVATQMVEFLKTECRRRKLREMFVITNENNVAAMRLYEKTGGKRPHPDDAMFDYDLTKS